MDKAIKAVPKEGKGKKRKAESKVPIEEVKSKKELATTAFKKFKDWIDEFGD